MWKSMLATFGFSAAMDFAAFLTSGVTDVAAAHWYFSPYTWMVFVTSVVKSLAVLVFGGIAKVYARYADKKAKK
jgi:hypothetical protein